MKTFRTTILLFMASILVGQLNAQPPQRSPEERAKRETAMVKEQIVLTDSQTVKYEAIALKYAKIRDEQFKGIPRDSMQVFRIKMNELNEKKKAEVKPVLTTEQFTKYEKWLDERRGRMGGGNQGNPPQPQ
jgi:periplasmic protein CpxP/Spy